MDLSARFRKQNGQGQRRGTDFNSASWKRQLYTRGGAIKHELHNANPSLSALRKEDTTYDVCTAGTGGQEMPKFA